MHEIITHFKCNVISVEHVYDRFSGSGPSIMRMRAGLSAGSMEKPNERKVDDFLVVTCKFSTNS